MTGKPLMASAGAALFLLGMILGSWSISKRNEDQERTRRREESSRSPEKQSATGRLLAERAAIAGMVRKGMRPASIDDSELLGDQEELELLYGTYDPYFVRGDLNGDGIGDFVQAFVRESSGGALFDVYAFFGVEGGGFRAPVLVARGLTLGQGDLSIDRSLVLVTPDLRADGTIRLRFDPESQMFFDVDAARDPDDDPVESEPRQRIRLRA
jgi:hypothetical protein